MNMINGSVFSSRMHTPCVSYPDKRSPLMPIKEYLSQVFILEKSINSKLRYISWLREISTNGTSKACALRISGTSKHSPMEEAVVKIIDLERAVDKAIDQQVARKQEINALIETLWQVDYRNLLSLRYLEFKTWQEITEILGYSWRNVHYIHAKALAAVNKEWSKVLHPGA